ncbi:MAG: leucine-rich repeat domain-containing protein, partial [Candidatus Thorarchaeota archaeon]
MEDIVLVYRTRRGEDAIILEPEVTQIDLSYRHISEIDLSPLSQCRHLEVLDLSSNLLQTIDLWPLMR